MRFKLFDRVLHRGYNATFIDYDKDDNALIVFDDEKFGNDTKMLIHTGLNSQLVTVGHADDLNLPNRCRYVDESSLTLLYSIGDTVQFQAYGHLKKGTYAAITSNGSDLPNILIEVSIGGHNGDRSYTKDLINRPLSITIPATHNYLWHEGELCDIKKIDENHMTYVATNTIVGSEIIKHDPCRTEFENFVQQYGFFNEIEWTKEIEEKFEAEDGWISFLVNNDFLEENEIIEEEKVDKEIKLDTEKVYCFKWGDEVYKICNLTGNEYNLAGITSTSICADGKGNCSWEEIVSRCKEYNARFSSNVTELRVFDSIADAINFYL